MCVCAAVVSLGCTRKIAVGNDVAGIHMAFAEPITAAIAGMVGSFPGAWRQQVIVFFSLDAKGRFRQNDTWFHSKPKRTGYF